MNRQNTDINHEGYIDSIKIQWNTRLLVLNLNRCRPSDNQKNTYVNIKL